MPSTKKAQETPDQPSEPKMTEGAGAKAVRKMVSSEGKLQRMPQSKKNSRKAAGLQGQKRALYSKYVR